MINLSRQEVQAVLEVPTWNMDTLKHIEKVGRICYQSEGKIAEGTAEKFSLKLFELNHNAMIEHSWLVLEVRSWDEDINEVISAFENHKFIRTFYKNGYTYFSGNWRAYIECLDKVGNKEFFLNMPHSVINEIEAFNVLFNIKQDISIVLGEDIPEEIRAYTVILKTDRAVSHELVRHRPASFAQESQRYVAYREDVEFIIPEHYNDPDSEAFKMWVRMMEMTEKVYKYLLKTESPQQARSVLPNCTATQIAITTDTLEWELIFGLRTSKAAYGPMRNIMNQIKIKMESLNSYFK
jgi:thymidylate synthase (FAD)